MYWLHKFKHMACGLHFIVCSDYPNWPNEGTTRQQKVGEATGLVTCPECGGTDDFLRWSEQVEGFIFESVPGNAALKAVR